MLVSPNIITGNGAVGFPLVKLIKSGSAKEPENTNKRNETRLNTSKSLNVVAPMQIKLNPNASKPTTSAN